MSQGIYKKLHAIMKEANYIQKDKENPHFHYRYASEAAIKEKLHELLVKHDVIFNASTLNQQAVEIGRDSKGNPRFRTTLDLAYRFIDIEDGSSIEGTMVGAGCDSEDKGTYKAITGALKYCLTSQFVIPTGDDPENEDGEREKQSKLSSRKKESTTIGTVPEPQSTDSDVSLEEMLQNIDVSNLNEESYQFVEQTKERYAKYGDRIRMSPKQLGWLKRLYREQIESASDTDGIHDAGDFQDYSA